MLVCALHHDFIMISIIMRNDCSHVLDSESRAKPGDAREITRVLKHVMALTKPTGPLILKYEHLSTCVGRVAAPCRCLLLLSSCVHACAWPA